MEKKQDSGMEKRPTNSAATPPRRLSPAPRASHEMIQAMEEQNVSLELLDLPEEITLKILSYLPVSDLVLRVQKICRRFRELSRSPCLWRDVIFKYDSERHTHDTFLSYYYGLQKWACLSKVTSLTESCMDVAPLYHQSIIKKPRTYSQLQRLVLQVSVLPSADFLSTHTGLRSLTIGSVYTHGCADSFTRLFIHLKSCTDLHTLQLPVGRCLLPWDSVKTMWVAMKDYFQTGPALTRLRLDIPVNDDIVTTILDCCEKLKDLQLSNGHLTRRVFKKTLTTPNVTLTALRLKGCPLTDPSMVYAISQSFWHLKELELSLVVTASTLFQWSQASRALLSADGFQELTSLKVEERERLTDMEQSIQETNEYNADEPLPACEAMSANRENGQLKELEFSDGGSLELLGGEFQHLSFQPDLRSLVMTTPTYLPHHEPARGRRLISAHCVQTLVDSCPQLQHVDLRGIKIPVVALYRLRDLSRLKTVHCSVYQGFMVACGPPENGEDTREIPLSSLEVDWHEMPSMDIDKLFPYFPYVTKLTINLQSFTHSEFRIPDIARSLPSVQHFRLKRENYKTREPHSPTFEDLCRFLTSGHQLRVVSWMVPVGLINERELAEAVVRHPTLSRLDINWGEVGHSCRTRFSKAIRGHLEEQMTRLRVRGAPSRLITVKFTKSKITWTGYEIATLCLSVHRRKDNSLLPDCAQNAYR